MNRTRMIIFVSLLLLGAAFLIARPKAVAPSPSPAKAALTVTVERPDTRTWPQKITATGNVQAWQEAIIGAEVAGLRLAEVNVNVGDSVKQGQVLARFADEMVNNDLAQQQAALEEARAKLAEAEVNAAGAQKLKDSVAMSAQEVQQYLTNAQSARAQVQMAEARLQAEKLRLRYTRVTAPDDGVISARSATVGAVMQTGSELFRLIRRGRLEWRAELPESQLQTVRIGQKVLLHAAQGEPVAGVVRRISPVVDVQSRNGAVFVELTDSRALKAGMFAQGEFVMGNLPALTLPQSALVVRDGYAYVYRVEADNRVIQLKVATGRRFGERIEIIGGIKPGESFVAAGAGFLNDGDRVRIENTQPAARQK